LLVVKNDGTGEKALFTNRPLPSDSHVPAWSPDGKTIVIPTVQPSKDALSGFLAVDAATGKALWHFQCGASVYSSPMSFAIGGKQYVAVAAGSALFTFGLP